jgi:hypothetical protein
MIPSPEISCLGQNNRVPCLSSLNLAAPALETQISAHMQLSGRADCLSLIGAAENDASY